jgi:hypothetical protein
MRVAHKSGQLDPDTTGVLSRPLVHREGPMSILTQLRHSVRIGIALTAALFVGAILPVAVQAAPVNLGTAAPFVALGGSTVTNTGPSVLNGDLGVSPGTALVGFGLPATVNGATHANTAVAAQAQSDLTAAYLVAEEEPVPPANDLTGTDLGNRTLAAGAYGYTSSAQLTGTLTLDAGGDPDAQFVFEIGSTLTTAPASSVVLVNSASPCNVFWQVGSSATLDTTTAFQGNLMALTDVSLNDGATVIGRVFARNGQISLINNVLDGSACGTSSTPPPPTSPPVTTSPPATTPASTTSPPAGDGATPGDSPGVGPAVPGRRPRRTWRTRSNGRSSVRRGPPAAPCRSGFRATVRGHLIESVAYTIDGERIASQPRSPFAMYVKSAPGRHVIRVRITYRDATRVRTKTLAYRACAAAVLQPRDGPSQFTG